MTILQTRPSPSLISLSHTTANKFAFFCFPYAGAGASVYRNWPQYFESDIGLFAIQAPGRETRFSETFVASIAELANQVCADILQTTDLPVVLFGHSLGAACAFETARALERADRPPKLLILSGRQSPGSQSKRVPIAHLNDAEFQQHVMTYKGTPPAVLENQEMMDLLMPLLRADFALAETYSPDLASTLSCNILGLGSTDDEWLDSESLERWGMLTTGAFNTHWFEGDHFYLNRQTQTLAMYLQEKIRKV